MNDITDFLEQNFLSDEYFQLDKLKDAFISEMTKGLNDETSSSLLMLPSFAMVDSEIMLNKKIAVIDAGGTNIRFGLVWFDSDGGYHVDNFKKMDMPGTDVTLTKDEFFAVLAELVLPYLSETDIIAISFAYPTTITKDMDGKIIKVVKELKISGAEGCLIGEELKEKLAVHGKNNIRVMVTNDTNATAFAGIAETINQNFNSHIGVIVGTGLNTCYPERFSEIGKLPDFTGGARMMVNTESGNFDQILRSDVDKAFDETTADTGYHVLEKMVSGGYIGGLCSAYLSVASDSQVFTIETVEQLKSLSLSSKDISDFLDDTDDAIINHAIKNGDDKIKARIIIEKVIRRAANLTALQIYCLATKCSKPGDNVCVTVEGTTFYKLPGLQSQTAEFLNLYMPKAGLDYQMMSVDDAVMKGCAAIGLQQ